MKFSALKGLAIVDLQDAKKLGDLEDLLLDPSTRQVLGLKVKTSGLFTTPLLIPILSVKNVGTDAITVVYAAPDGDRQNPNSSPNAASGSPDLHTLVGLSQILDNQVVTDSGTLVGHIKDIEIDQSNLRVSGYEVSVGSIFTKNQQFPVTPDVRYGEKLVTVPQELLNQQGK